MEYPAFCGGSNPAQALTLDQERTVNLYFEPSQEEGSTAKSALYPTPGVELLATAVDGGPGYGHFFINGREFAVIGPKFIEINVDGVMTIRGAVALGATPATISANGDGGQEIFITAGDNGYIFDLQTAVFTQIAALNGKATMGGMLDGYFLALDTATSTVYVSELLDGLTWNTGVMFFQRSSAPDKWVAMKVTNKYIWLLGEETAEVWQDVGTIPVPFAPHPSGVIPIGNGAAFSLAVSEGVLYWLGASDDGTGFVLRSDSFSPQIISTYALQREINSYAVTEDAIAWTYNDRGHSFYVLTFPSANHTWLWDDTAEKWTELLTWISEENRYVAWRPAWQTLAFGEHRILDRETGGVYRMSSDLGLDVDEREIRRLRRAPSPFKENKRLMFPAFELDMEPGLGNAVPPGDDPQVMMRTSNDGGRTWGAEQWRDAGKIGEYGRRVRWLRGGSGRRRVYEVAFSEVTPFRITNAYLPGAKVAELEAEG